MLSLAAYVHNVP